MGDTAEISLINLNMMSNGKENKQNNNNNGAHDNGDNATGTTIEEASCSITDGKCSYEYLMPFLPGVGNHEVPCYN
jgi:hypothetical protein